MALARKKQDEKNLKTLRELVALPCNKYCFDCNQRGPTYVNVTIGSFVCTKCSGMLRGLTPPHRVKSISMATFTTDEIELLRTKGNAYCKRVWLGLYDGGTTTAPPHTEEHTIRDFMIDKYERKRFYIEPQNVAAVVAVTNGHESFSKSGGGAVFNQLQAPQQQQRPQKAKKVEKLMDFVADFSSADIFSAALNNNNVNSNGNNCSEGSVSFANFDNNPVFNGTNDFNDDFGIFDLNFTGNNNNNSDVFGNSPPIFTKCSPTYMSTKPQKTTTTTAATATTNVNNVMGPPAPPKEDKYAALKDLDNALKAQTTLDWNSGSSSSLHSSPTPAGSIYSSSSPQSSLYGSPSQGHFATVFPTTTTTTTQQQQQEPSTISNPFTAPLFWNANAGMNGQTFINPFQGTVDPLKMNGISYGFPNTNNGAATWTANPFKLGTASGGNSSNPFL